MLRIIKISDIPEGHIGKARNSGIHCIWGRQDKNRGICKDCGNPMDNRNEFCRDERETGFDQYEVRGYDG